MPTGAKLVASLCMALLAFVASEMIKPLFPENTAFGAFTAINVAIGVVCGWRIVGRGAGRGMAVALSNGVTAAVALLLWGLFAHAVFEMTDLAMQNRYDGFGDALVGIFENALEFGAVVAVPSVLGTLAAGGLVTGLLAELASRVWR